MRFSDALEGYWLERRRGFSEHTVRDYARTFNRFRLYTGDPHLDEIDADVIRDFLNEMVQRHQWSDKTLSNCWTALSSFWTWAEPELGVPHAMRGRVKRPKYNRPEIVPYTMEEVTAMKEACGRAASWRTSTGRVASGRRPTADRDRAIIIALVDTGLRASELCDLRIQDYNRDTGGLHVAKGKWKKERTVFVGEAGKKALWRYLLARKGAGPREPLFATRTLRCLDRNNLRQTLKRIGEKAGVTGVTVHRFRHTFAVNFLRNGGNVLALQRFLGHEKMETIRVYVRLASVDLQEVMRTASPADNWNL